MIGAIGKKAGARVGMGEKIRGKLLVIGGAEDKEGPCLILRRFLELAGGDKAKVAVVTTATERPYQVASEYSRLFLRLGATNVIPINICDRKAAGSPNMMADLDRVTGIFLTGGDQLRLTSILGGTVVGEALQVVVKRGTVLAGTSAGAAAMTDIMIVSGQEESAPKRSSVRLAPGLGFLEEMVVDQHFAERGRIGRLLAVIAQNPYILGLGLDEDTAIECDPAGFFTVIGSGVCTVVDGFTIGYSNVSDSHVEEPLALTQVTLHVLPAGYSFDLGSRQPGMSPV
jgi:cyanophycinase